MTVQNIQRSIEAVWRIEQARLIAGLTRYVRDVGLAEELAQDALVAALQSWPEKGMPERPGAWLMATAKRRAIDLFRRQKVAKRKHEEVGYDLELDQNEMPDPDTALDDHVGDDMLSLIFTSCHPLLSPEARVAMTLRLLGGLTTEEIARAFLVPEATVAQRIVRAKKTLSQANVPFEVPRGKDMQERLSSVLAVIYLIFNEGYSATGGGDWIRPKLCEEALRLGRILSGLTPDEPEVHGLVALMEIQASRLATRLDATGEPVLLSEQNRARWDRLLISRGLASLDRVEKLGGAAGPYALQAAIAACHARAGRAEDTDWARIAALYGVLGQVSPSPIIELNRAVAVMMVAGPEAALPIVEALGEEPTLKSYHLLPAVRGDFLARLDRFEEARKAFEEAASLTQNAREQALLSERAAACGRGERPAR